MICFDNDMDNDDDLVDNDGMWNNYYHDKNNDNHITPPKVNMEPKSEGVQKESPFPRADFQVQL